MRTLARHPGGLRAGDGVDAFGRQIAGIVFFGRVCRPGHRSKRPRRGLSEPALCNPPGGPSLEPLEYRLILSADGRQLSGTITAEARQHGSDRAGARVIGSGGCWMRTLRRYSGPSSSRRPSSTRPSRSRRRSRCSRRSPRRWSGTTGSSTRGTCSHRRTSICGSPATSSPEDRAQRLRIVRPDGRRQPALSRRRDAAADDRHRTATGSGDGDVADPGRRRRGGRAVLQRRHHAAAHAAVAARLRSRGGAARPDQRRAAPERRRASARGRAPAGGHRGGHRLLPARRPARLRRRRTGERVARAAAARGGRSEACRRTGVPARRPARAAASSRRREPARRRHRRSRRGPGCPCCW